MRIESSQRKSLWQRYRSRQAARQAALARRPRLEQLESRDLFAILAGDTPQFDSDRQATPDKMLVVITHGRTDSDEAPPPNSGIDPGSTRRDVGEWMYDMGHGIDRYLQRQDLGEFSGDFVAIPLPKLKGADSDAAILDLWQGPRDVAVVNWTQESNDGTPTNLGDALIGSDTYNEREHRAAVLATADAQFRLIRARVGELRAEDPTAKLDVLFIGHSFGTVVNRETVRMLNQSDVAEHLDYVQVTSLDPVAMRSDEQPEDRAETHDPYSWENPTLARQGDPIVDRVVNYFQRRGLMVGNNIEDGLILGQPLDGEVGGSTLGQFNDLVRVFDSQSGAEVVRLRSIVGDTVSPGAQVDVDYSSNGQLPAYASHDGSVTVVDAVTHNVRRRIEVSKKPLLSVEFLPNSKGMIVLAEDGKVREIDAESGEVVWQGKHVEEPYLEVSPDYDAVRRYYQGARHAAISVDGQWMVTHGTSQRIKVWKRDVTGVGFVHVQSLPSPEDGTLAAAFTSSGDLVTGNAEGRLRVWRPHDGRFVLAQKEDFGSPIRAMAATADGNRLAVSSGSRVALWERQANGEFRQTAEYDDHSERVEALAFSADGTKLASGGLDRKILIRNVRTGAIDQTLDTPMLDIRELALHPTSNRLAAVYFNNKGGPVIDIDWTGRYGVFDGWAAQAHKQVRLDYITEVVLTGDERFFTLRNSPDAIRFGDFEPVDTTPEEYRDTIDGLFDIEFDPKEEIDVIENLFAPEFVTSLSDQTIADVTSISLAELAVDRDGNSISWTVNGTDSGIATAVINGDSLTLTPVAEGRTPVTLVASDGLRESRMSLVVEVNAESIRREVDSLREDLRKLTSQMTTAQNRLAELGKQISNGTTVIASLEKEIQTLSKEVARLRPELASAEERRNRLQNEVAADTNAQSAAQASFNAATSEWQNARSTFEDLDRRTVAARQSFNQLDEQRQRAWQRYQQAPKREQAQRKAEWERARDQANAAESVWRSLQSQRNAADQQVSAAAKRRATAEDQLGRAKQRLRDSQQRLANAQRALVPLQSQRAQQVARRDTLLNRLAPLSRDQELRKSELAGIAQSLTGWKEKLTATRNRAQEIQSKKWVRYPDLQKLDLEVTAADRQLVATTSLRQATAVRHDFLGVQLIQTTNLLKGL